MGNKIFSSNKEEKKEKLRGFSLSSLRRNSAFRRMSWMPRPHLECQAWLTALDLLQYQQAFQKFSGVEDFLYYEECQIKELGVAAVNHRARIMASLAKLRDKYEKHHKLKGIDSNPRTSLIEKDHSCAHRERPLPSPPSGPRTSPVEAGNVILRTGTREEYRRNASKREAFVINQSLSSRMAYERKSEDAELQKLLDLELSLDSGDLRSHAWYHGSIPRQRAEEIIGEEEQFLIRDCNSHPGDYVLTCCWKSQALHFVIQKTVVQPHTVYERIQYLLEDDAYDSIPDLIRAYVGEKKSVTLSSGAKISVPINRTAPLSFYAIKYAQQTQLTKVHGTLSRPVPRTGARTSHSPLRMQYVPQSVGCTIVSQSSQSPPRLRRDMSPTVISSQGAITEGSHSSDGIIGHHNIVENSKFSSHSLPRTLSPKTVFLPSEELCKVPEATEPTAPSDLLEQEVGELPPPKPSRVPSFKYAAKKSDGASVGKGHVYTEIVENSENAPVINGKEPIPNDNSQRHSHISEVYQPSGSDSGNGSGDSVQTLASDTQNRDSRASFGEVLEEDSAADEEIVFQMPDMTPASAFDVENFSTLLLPSVENKPLDVTALKGVANILMESGSRILAAHITKVDLNLLNGFVENDFGLGISSGIELVTLPHGSQLRKDLIDRTECLKLFVAVTVLKTEDICERAELIHRWIQIAIDTKTAMGNLYGFCGIMLGLCIPEIKRLDRTWHILRQKFTDSAFQFESKLRSVLKCMNECTAPQAPNTTIPHILPFAVLCERDLDEVYSLHTKGSALLQWESTASDYGLHLLLLHLQETRGFAQNLTLYQRNAELLFNNWNHMDELTLDMFRTEFHLKFLFGSKAAATDCDERFLKFQKVIDTLSGLCEPID